MARIKAKNVVVNAWNDLNNNHTMALSAGLSYYFVLSLFPLLIVAAATLGLLPIPNLFDQILAVMARVVPADSMGLVRKVAADAIRANAGALLTVGILGTIWTASSGFSGLIEALNVAYDVPETRPFWKTRSLAIALTFLIGLLLVTALTVMIVGPRFGEWLAGRVGLGPVFVAVWPYVRWGLAISFTVLAVELIYYLAPNVRQRFWATLPGAAIGVGAWLALSYGLGVYFRSFGELNKTYGTLGAAIALMIWFYWSSLAILIGAEINSELLKAATDGRLELKQPPPPAVKPRPAWEERPAA
jgi:membrane protein